MIIITVLILTILIYFLSKWILNKWKLGNKKNRKFLAVIPTLILTPIFYGSLATLWLFSATYYPNINFDKQQWKENPENRYKMSEFIIEEEILIGKTKEEIVELLGNDFFSYDKNHIAYNLGFPPGFFIDSLVLDIYFRNKKVIKVDKHES